MRLVIRKLGFGIMQRTWGRAVRGFDTRAGGMASEAYSTSAGDVRASAGSAAKETGKGVGL